MPDQPVLSEAAKRKLAVQWDTIRDNHKIADEQLSGYDLGRQWLLGALAKPPRDMNLGGLNIGRNTSEDRRRTLICLGLIHQSRQRNGGSEKSTMNTGCLGVPAARRTKRMSPGSMGSSAMSWPNLRRSGRVDQT